ncbi:MAG: biotin carboxylase N-terminal domain-containing protein, partial [Candidatus Limnocylindrales bacterium]
MRETLGPGEAARRLGVSTRTVQRWLRDGRLPAIKVGERVKVDARALEAASGLGSRAHEPELARERLGPPGAATVVGPMRRLLVANRGELVVRIARTCRRLGVTCLALVTDDQRAAWWAGQADEVVPLAGTYLDGAAVIEAARAAGADAVHPGYGFLAE